MHYAVRPVSAWYHAAADSPAAAWYVIYRSYAVVDPTSDSASGRAEETSFVL